MALTALRYCKKVGGPGDSQRRAMSLRTRNIKRTSSNLEDDGTTS